jgi:hypothetical protein
MIIISDICRDNWIRELDKKCTYLNDVRISSVQPLAFTGGTSPGTAERSLPHLNTLQHISGCAAGVRPKYTTSNDEVLATFYIFPNHFYQGLLSMHPKFSTIFLTPISTTKDFDRISKVILLYTCYIISFSWRWLLLSCLHLFKKGWLSKRTRDTGHGTRDTGHGTRGTDLYPFDTTTIYLK